MDLNSASSRSSLATAFDSPVHIVKTPNFMFLERRTKHVAGQRNRRAVQARNTHEFRGKTGSQIAQLDRNRVRGLACVAA
jgi:hypothetical protein